MYQMVHSLSKSAEISGHYGEQRGREGGKEEERDRESDDYVKIFSVFKTSKVDACPLNPPTLFTILLPSLSYLV